MQVYMRQSLFGLAASSQQYANKVVDRVNTQAQVHWGRRLAVVRQECLSDAVSLSAC